MTQAVRGFNEQLERIVEVAIVIIVGAMLTLIVLPQNAIVYLLLLFFVVRPLAVGSASPDLTCRATKSC